MIFLTLVAATTVAVLYGSLRLSALAMSVLLTYLFPTFVLGVLVAVILAGGIVFFLFKTNRSD